MSETYTIGLDFGTESVRAVLVETHSGRIAASASAAYPDSVIDRSLPGLDQPLPPDYALQNASDWVSGMESTVKQVLEMSEVDPHAVVGLGIDFTACTILPVTAQGEPLAWKPEFRQNKHAWPKLWKHHAAQEQANRVNQLATRRKE
ncbi:MAG TPA: FGGY family carbohydrate kinase, partial [Anaerolineaceae bacterium]